MSVKCPVSTCKVTFAAKFVMEISENSEFADPNEKHDLNRSCVIPTTFEVPMNRQMFVSDFQTNPASAWSSFAP